MPELLHIPEIQLFTDYLQFEKRYSPHTILAYRKDLEQFFIFLQIKQHPVHPLKDITSVQVRLWLASLLEEQCTGKTVNRKISTLKAFFKYFLRTGLLQTSPMTVVVSPKISRRLPVFVEQKHTETLFNHIEFKDDWAGKTERLVLALLYSTGMRVSELINLTESEADTRQKRIKVLGKGNKERMIPIDSDMAYSIETYMKEKRRMHPSGEEGFLLVNGKGKKLYAKYVYLVVKKYLSQVTSVQKKSPHVLRHTFATHLTNHGADLNAVKALLGHSSLAATQIYTHNTIDKLKEVYQKAHPKAG